MQSSDFCSKAVQGGGGSIQGRLVFKRSRWRHLPGGVARPHRANGPGASQRRSRGVFKIPATGSASVSHSIRPTQTVALPFS